MVILSRVDACAPPYPTMYTGSGDVKQKRRARRPEGEEWSEAVIRNLRQQVKYALRFFVVETALHQNPKQLSLSPPSRTAASASSQAGQSNKTKETFSNRRGHNAVAVPFSGRNHLPNNQNTLQIYRNNTKKSIQKRYLNPSSQNAASTSPRAEGNSAQNPHVSCVHHACPPPLIPGVRHTPYIHRLLDT